MVSDISKIFLSSSKLSIVKDTQSFHTLPPLQKGQLLQAKVVKTLSGRQSQLVILGKTLLAQTHTPLKTGETILLRVVQSTPTPVFKIEQSDTPPIKQLLDAVKSSGRTGPFKHIESLIRQTMAPDISGSSTISAKIISHFIRLIQNTALQSEQTNPGLLNRFIENSGLKWENKLRSFFTNPETVSLEKAQDLINNDMKALALIPDPEHTTHPSLQSFSQGIENLQLLNHNLFEESGRFIFHLPILFDGTLTFGQLFIDLNHAQDAKTQDERTLRVSFLLEMTRLGEFLADFSILNHQISGSFGVANPEIQIMIQENLPELETKLKSHGFIVYPITCRLLSPETIAGTSLIEKIFSSPDQGMVNILI
jgi:hypothetical protein